MPDRFADASQPAVFDQPGSTLIEWWRKGLFFFLCLSVLFLGIGGVELPVLDVGVSAWSISRTTFFFWLIWKFLIWNRYGRERLAVELKRIPVPAAVFFGCVTLSLLPTFHPAGDYRYFVFGFMHYLMVLEFCSEDRRPQLLYVLLALLPGDLAYSVERFYMQTQQYGMLVLFALLWFGGHYIGPVINGPADLLYRLIVGQPGIF